MDYMNMESANMRQAQALAAEQAMLSQRLSAERAMHSQGLAMEQQKLALSQWEAQQRWTLEYMMWEASKAASAAATGNIDLAKELALYKGTESGAYLPMRREQPIWNELF